MIRRSRSRKPCPTTCTYLSRFDPQTKSYFVATVGDTLEVVKHYVENQRNI